MEHKFSVLSFLLPLFLSSVSVTAQTPIWSHHIGGSTDDEGRVCKIAPNGNIYLAGRFSGTVDLDPGIGVYSVSSNGSDDIFLACYTSTGNFLWGFGIGGSNYDAAVTASVDDSNNVIIGGYFQSNVDFDPGPLTTTITYSGGSNQTYYGDGFLAKYNSSGVFQWARGLGGSTVYDFVTNVEVDGAQNVYACGEFTDVMTVSPAITWNSATTGKGYIIKYDPSGNVLWANVFGLPGVAASDTYPHCMLIKGNRLYVCGVFQGTSFFDQNNPGGSTLVAAGTYDAWLARYDTAGNFAFIKTITGPGNIEEAFYLDADSLENIYTIGYTSSAALTFNTASPGTSTVSAPGGGGNNDIFLAKYDSLGTFQWGELFGSSGQEMGYKLSILDTSLYMTGLFSNTVDFDASAGLGNLVSNGNTDIYLCKYDLNGNYLCGFGVGGAGYDGGRGLDIDTSGKIIATGGFSGSNVDFDPSPLSVLNLSSNGLSDVYLTQYLWNNCGFVSSLCNLAGTFEDSLVGCRSVLITASLSGANGPTNFQWQFGDGTTGTGNPVSHTYATNGSYVVTLVVSDSLGCSDTITQTISVNGATADFTISNNSVCIGQPVTFSATPTGQSGASYSWNFDDGSVATGSQVSHSYNTAGTYGVTLYFTDSLGCNDTVSHTVSVDSVHADFTISNDTVCSGQSITFTSNATGPQPLTYHWFFGDGGTASTASTTHAYSTDGTYLVSLIVTSPGACVDTAEKTIYVGNPTPDSLTAIICADSSFMFGTQLIDTAGIFTQIFTSTSGCDSIVVLTVDMNPQPSVDFTSTTTLNMPVTFTNNSVNASSFLWEFGDGSTSNDFSPVHQYTNAGTHTVCLTGWNDEGCSEKTCKEILTEIFTAIDVPLAFSPNGDGNNDVLYVRGGGVKEMTFRIYNRWGQMIFESHSLNEGWDGRFKGKAQDLETVAYVLQATFIDGTTVQKQGNVTILH